MNNTNIVLQTLVFTKNSAETLINFINFINKFPVDFPTPDVSVFKGIHYITWPTLSCDIEISVVSINEISLHNKIYNIDEITPEWFEKYLNFKE